MWAVYRRLSGRTITVALTSGPAAGAGYHAGVFAHAIETTRVIFDRGGWVMWPLLALSVVSVALSVERLAYWGVTHRPGRSRWLALLSGRLRAGDAAGARAIIGRDGSIYGRVVGRLLDRRASDAAIIELIEVERPQIERFSISLSTIITVAPLLGILGTVLGIIDSFQLLGTSGGLASDPSQVADGIAKALITTAFGLIISAFTLFPYAMVRSSASRCIGRLESLGAAALQGACAKADSGRGSGRG